MKKITPVLSLISFIIFTLIILWSNGQDWDHFFSTAEADIRSWLVYHEVPLWSYQFCAGVTRLGDPQALSLSPLFIFHLFFGPILGHKFMIIALTALGIYFGKKILELFFDLQESILWGISTLTLTSNFFIWHMIAGHVTFSLFSLGLGILYYLLKEADTPSFSWKRSISLLFLVQILFSSSFYPVTVYLFLPLVPLFIYFFIKRFQNLKSFFIFSFLGLIFSSYKWLYVLLYQLQHPRSLPLVDKENSSISQLFLDFFIPSSYTKLLISPDISRQWAIWEYSYFTPLFLFFIIFFFALKWEPLDTKKFIRNTLLVAVLPLLLSLGNFSQFAPYSLINHYLFNDSLRVSSRFGLPLLFLISLTIAYLFEKLPSLKRSHLFICCILFLNTLNLLFFLNICSPDSLQKLTQILQKESTVQNLVLIMPPFNTKALSPIVQGVGIANCYNPLSRNINLIKKIQATKESVPVLKYFIEGQDISDQCRTKSYFTANQLIIDPSCPKRFCLNLNDINPKEISRFSYNAKDMTYCRE